MPEQRFRVRWPDGSTEDCYLLPVIRDHLRAGEAYPVGQFAQIAKAALEEANARVRARFGMGCSQALMQMAAIEAQAARFADQPDGLVEVEAFLP
jgi:uncharacterized repeat protein (TIGR04042 family)